MKRNNVLRYILMIILLFTFLPGIAGRKDKKEKTNTTLIKNSLFSGLKFRSIGPAFKSGRIADIAIHPKNPDIWYVAAGSGGVWKTVNSGITWRPVFDNQKVFSIGCITVDSSNPHIVWVGTGENVGGRHVGWGDGIYKSTDDGKTWKNMGLKHSEHISKIIVHPGNSDIVWVAAQGPLWSEGGDRGLYKTTDGGKTWKQVLKGDNGWTGVTDIALNPENPDIIYAAAWQRGRTVAAYMGGGPGSAIYRSDDGGETWKKLTKGLPSQYMGKIGLAVSPQNPDVVYAAIELERRKGAVYRSDDRGETWKKMSNTVSGATGPHYYQELYASPHKFDRIYLADVRMRISDDGGKTFRTMSEKFKHSDNHALAFRKDKPGYILTGTDGGLYESFDFGKNWRFVNNLPLTQFYFIAVDDSKPFYNIYGGTQDNNTEAGPSRTDNSAGISNCDWKVILNADGSQPAVEPDNPDIVYAQSQEGYLYRVDMKTGERTFIQPQPGEGEDFERFNWNAPVLISPHSPTRLYFGSQRLWRSDDRGDTWRPVSGDLTNHTERLKLPVMGKTWSWDAPWDVYAMSTYNTITAISESPVKEGLIYVGTDDGRMQKTSDGGKHWQEIPVNTLPGVPASAYVNDIKTDLFDENTVYVALDNHKTGDLKPYVYKSKDGGKSWVSLKNNLPDTTIVWRIVQDYKEPRLLFLATEFGMYFSLDAGEKWVKFTSGLPTISFRDAVLQKDKDDLVCASFGRGIYILDDYSCLRNVKEDSLKKEALLFKPRNGYWYIPKLNSHASSGASFFTAPNPCFGVTFTYYLKDSYKTLKDKRLEKERKLKKENKPVTFPGWDEVEKEKFQQKPEVFLTVVNSDGDIVKRVNGSTAKGIHRLCWDLRWSVPKVLVENEKNKDFSVGTGILAAPGKYKAYLAKKIDGVVTRLTEPVEFEVVPLREGTLKKMPPDSVEKFWKEINKTIKYANLVAFDFDNIFSKVNSLQKVIKSSPEKTDELVAEIYNLRSDLLKIKVKLYGRKAPEEIGEKQKPAIFSRIGVLYQGLNGSTYGPVQTITSTMKIINDETEKVSSEIKEIKENRLPGILQKVKEAGIDIVE